MSRSTAFGMIVLLIGVCCRAQTQHDAVAQTPISSQPRYSIALTGPTDPIKLGALIKVTVTVTNITDGDLYWDSDLGKDSAYKEFKFLLTKNGREVDATFFHRKVSGRQREGDPHEVSGGSSIVLAHPPGKMFEIPIDVTRLYKITEPGLYTLEVSRYDQKSRVMVRSNPLTLKIEK